jgi:hypothetical protein
VQVNEHGEAPLFGTDEIPRDTYRQPEGHGTGQTSSQAEDWYTHPEVVALVHEMFGGPPDLDPMSCAEANLVVRAKEYYTAEADGLLQPWRGTVLLNPPWGGTGASAVKKRALRKLLDSYANGEVTEAICVLNANAITTRWFAPLLEFPLCIPPRRIEHYGPGGKGGSPNSGTVISYLGPYRERFTDIFACLGKIMRP